MPRVKTLYKTLILLTVLYAFFCPDNYFLNFFKKALKESTREIKEYLDSEKDIRFLFKFDQPDITEWLSGKKAIAAGTVTVQAENSSGRKFKGREKTFIEFPISWQEIGSNYTVAMRIKISDKFKNQSIFYNTGLHKLCGLHLSGGTLFYDVPSTQKRQYASYPFKKYNEFVHITASVDLFNKKLKLYENGELKSETEIHMVDGSFLNMMLGKPMWYEVLYPFKGVVESIVMWHKVLSPKEIKKLANTKNYTLLTHAGYINYYKLKLNQLTYDLLKTTTKFFDVLKSFTISSFANSFKNKQLPEVHIIMSGQDNRHFVNSHRRSLLSGRRTRSASRSRTVKIIHNNKAISAKVKLNGTNTDYNDSKRASYIIQTEAGSLMGLKKVLLSPPESSGFLLPIINSNLRKSLDLPFLKNGFCRLKINGMFRGVYYYEDFKRMGLLPGELKGICDGIALHQGAGCTFFDREKFPLRIEKTDLTWPAKKEDLSSLYSSAYKKYAELLLHDIQSPFTKKEKEKRLKQDKALLNTVWKTAPENYSAAKKYAEFLNEFMLLGKNDSPQRIVHPLNLKLFPSKNIKLKWQSLNSSILKNDGTITRPSDNNPVFVDLKAIISDETQTHEKLLHFRVMPANIKIPAIMLYANQTPKKTLRVDSLLEICGINEDTPTRFLSATQGNRGGINHRGNTSFFHNKKLFLIKTDQPHNLITESDSRVIKAINSQTDKTFIKNRLAYELFRAFSPESRITPHIKPYEVFVNGYYHGLFEFAERLPREPDTLYKHSKIPPHNPYMRNISEQLSDPGSPATPYNKLEKIMEIKDSNIWLSEIKKVFDFANMIDMQLLLNFTQNLNGYPFDFTAHEILAYKNDPEGYFYYIPWDFDTTFETHEWRWIANNIMKRLMAEHPPYRQKLIERWKNLRLDILKTESLLKRVDKLASTVEGFTESDYLRWNYSPVKNKDDLKTLKDMLNRNINKMDEFLLQENNNLFDEFHP